MLQNMFPHSVRHLQSLLNPFKSPLFYFCNSLSIAKTYKPVGITTFSSQCKFNLYRNSFLVGYLFFSVRLTVFTVFIHCIAVVVINILDIDLFDLFVCTFDAY